jgi:hypothetical protein
MLEEGKDFVADDGVSSVPSPVTPAGGEDKKKKGKPEDKIDTKADEKTPGQGVKAEEVETEEEVVVESSIASIFEGEELSEDFRNKMTVVFEAAVNEEVATKTQGLQEELEAQLEAQLSEAVESKMSSVVENVDKYLDYVIGEWMVENKIAIESGIKVEMAESLMSGLKDLFQEHNVEVNEETFDVVASLESQVTDLEDKGNAVVNENIELQRTISAMKAERVFEGMTEGLSENQIERFKVLSEKLDVEDLEDYTSNLVVIKESFFSEGKIAAPKVEDVEEDEIILEEQEVTKPASDYSSINALVEALNTRK